MVNVKFTKISPINAGYATWESEDVDYDLSGGDENFLFFELDLSDFNIAYISVRSEPVGGNANSTYSLLRTAKQGAVEGEYVPVPSGILKIGTGALVIKDFNFNGFGSGFFGIGYIKVGGTTGTLKSFLVEAKSTGK